MHKYESRKFAKTLEEQGELFERKQLRNKELVKIGAIANLYIQKLF